MQCLPKQVIVHLLLQYVKAIPKFNEKSTLRQKDDGGQYSELTISCLYNISDQSLMSVHFWPTMVWNRATVNVFKEAERNGKNLKLHGFY